MKAVEASYLDKIGKVIGTRVVLAVLCEENNTKAFMPNFDQNIDSLAKNGTFANWPAAGQNCRKKFLENYTLLGSIERIHNMSKKELNTFSNITVTSFSIDQREPWAIIARMNVTILIKSPAASWLRNTTIE